MINILRFIFKNSALGAISHFLSNESYSIVSDKGWDILNNPVKSRNLSVEIQRQQQERKDTGINKLIAIDTDKL